MVPTLRADQGERVPTVESDHDGSIVLDSHVEGDGRILGPEPLPLANHLGGFGGSLEDQQEPGNMAELRVQEPAMGGIPRRAGADLALIGQAPSVCRDGIGEPALILQSFSQAIGRPGTIRTAVDVVGGQAEERLAKLDRLSVRLDCLGRAPSLDQDPADLMEDRRQTATVFNIERRFPRPETR